MKQRNLLTDSFRIGITTKMHPYATDDDKTATLYGFIAVLSVISAYLLYLALKVTGLSDSLWFLDIPSVPGFSVLYYKLFDRKFWNKSLSKKVGLNVTPDFSGTWTGELQSSHDNFVAQTSVTLKIRQTGSHISLVLKTDHSESESCLAMIFTRSSTGAVIQYAYQNLPSNSAVDTMHAHEGTTKLVLSADGQSLAGNYYTGRDRENRGTLTLVRAE